MTYQLWLGDCLEEMSRIEAGSIDMILADLPYGTTACKWDIVIPFELLWKHYKRIAKKNCAILLFGAEPFSSLLRISNLEEYAYDWIWVKDRITRFLDSNRRPLDCYENISMFYNKQPLYKPQKWSGKLNHNKGSIVGSQGKRDIYHGSFIEVIADTSGEKYPRNVIFCQTIAPPKKLHTNEKPLPLLEYFIETYSNESDLILDNTMGSGSTGEACLRTSRRFIGIEKDQKYFEIAQKRLEKVAAELSGEFVEKKSEESHPRDSEWLF